MKVAIFLPEYMNPGIRVFWEKNSIAAIEAKNEIITITGTIEAFTSFAKQMLYFCFGSSSSGCHVHFDSFFCKSNLIGMNLLIELKRDTRITDLYGFDDAENPIEINIPEYLYEKIWYSDAEINVIYDSNEVCMSGNRIALYCIAKKMLSMCHICAHERSATEYCYPLGLEGWHGAQLRLRVQTTYL